MMHAHALDSEPRDAAPGGGPDGPEMEAPRPALRLVTRSGASAEVATEQGAEVLRVRDPGGAVLFEYDAATGTGALRMPAGLRLEAAQGSIDIVARDGVRCAAGGEVVLTGGTLVAAAKQAELHFERARYIGRAVDVAVEKAETLFGELSTRAETLLEHAGNVFRQVRELHQLHANRIRTRSDGGMRMEGGHVVMVAKEEVHIDGENIHLG